MKIERTTVVDTQIGKSEDKTSLQAIIVDGKVQDITLVLEDDEIEMTEEFLAQLLQTIPSFQETLKVEKRNSTRAGVFD